MIECTFEFTPDRKAEIACSNGLVKDVLQGCIEGQVLILDASLEANIAYSEPQRPALDNRKRAMMSKFVSSSYRIKQLATYPNRVESLSEAEASAAQFSFLEFDGDAKESIYD